MKGIINRRASKKVNSYYRDNRIMNKILESKKTIENNEKIGGNNDVK